MAGACANAEGANAGDVSVQPHAEPSNARRCLRSSVLGVNVLGVSVMRVLVPVSAPTLIYGRHRILDANVAKKNVPSSWPGEGTPSNDQRLAQDLVRLQPLDRHFPAVLGRFLAVARPVVGM